LDTRTKIIEPGSIPRHRPVRILVSYLDPLWSDQVAALQRHVVADETVVLAIDDPPEALMPMQARAELAAALAFIDSVVLSTDALALVPGAEVIDLRHGDLDRRDALMRQVLRRHRSE
jgi:hypothetical protein